MDEADRIRVADMAMRVDLIVSWVAGASEAEFLIDLKTRDAVALNIQLLGETARRLSREVKSTEPSIPWESIVALRNRIAHGYETVDHAMVWRVVQDDLPPLRAALTRMARA